MLYLLDTCAFSDLLREHPATKLKLETLSEDDSAVICTVVRGEVLYGISKMPNGRKRDSLVFNAVKYLDGLPCHALSEDVADRYAELKRSRQKQGLTLDENDLWIAASAAVLGAVLVTRDRDFQGIVGLDITDWSVEDAT